MHGLSLIVVYCRGSCCCGIRALEHVGFSSCCPLALEPGLSSRGARAWLPPCPSPCTWNFPCRGLNLYPLHWQTDSSPLGHQKSPVLHQPACVVPTGWKILKAANMSLYYPAQCPTPTRLYWFPLLRNKCHILRRSEQPLVINSQFFRLGSTECFALGITRLKTKCQLSWALGRKSCLSSFRLLAKLTSCG